MKPNISRRIVAIAAAVLAVAVAARVSLPLPGTPVPQSLQTLAVVLAGWLLGARWGAVALAAYVAVGAAGLPVFAVGAAGWGRLVGPTGGYLAGFILGAAAAGAWRDRGWSVRFAPALAGMVLAHAVILGAGWARLALLTGWAEAYTQGVAPFLVGGLAKSAVAALVAVAVGRRWPVEPDPAEV